MFALLFRNDVNMNHFFESISQKHRSGVYILKNIFPGKEHTNIMLKKKPGLSPSLKLEDFELIFESIMENSKDGLFVVDKEGMVVMVNQATQDMFDFKTSEVLGRNVRDLVKEGFYQPSVSVLVIQQKSIISLIQTTRHKKKILSTGIPIFDDAGQIKFVLVNDRDISHINMLAQSLYPEDLPQDRLRLDFSHQDLAAGELENGNKKSSHDPGGPDNYPGLEI
jgi:PAS domain S-box-containing protein